MNSLKKLLIITTLAMGLTACGSPEEVDPKTLYSQYYIENYEIDATKAFSQMFFADVTHDGNDEMIVVNQEYLEMEHEFGIGTVDVLSQDTEGNIERIFDWYISHTEGTYLYLTEIDGEQYLMQYFPTEYQGICAYKYETFSLSEEGERLTYKEVAADIWNTNEMNYIEKKELSLKAEEFEQNMRDEMYNAVALIEFGPKLPSVCTLKTEVDRVNDILSEIHMQPDGAGEYDKYLEKKWIAGYNVKVRKVPYNTELDNMISNWLSYTRVDIKCIVLGEYNEEEDRDKVFKQYNDPWALISFYSTDTALDTVGWVQLNELIEYTEETKYLLNGPVSLAEGAVDANTGKTVEFKSGLFVTGEEGDYVLLFAAGGIVYKVHKDYVVYPEP